MPAITKKKPKPSKRLSREIYTEGQFTSALGEIAKRRQEAIRIYRPRPDQLPFHLSKAPERLIGGGNRSGKTVAAAVETASAALGQPLVGPDEQPIPFRYPKPPMVIWLVGFDERHIARMGRKLFNPLLFKVIRDRQTGLLRAWKPWEPEDAEREEEAIYAPPLIPDRMIESWAWEDKAKGVFSKCSLKNGTEFYAYPSGSEAMIGDFVHLIWIDEDVTNPDIIPELQARLADVRGRLIWSSWPRVSNDALFKMHERAQDEAHKADPDIFSIRLKFSENPYIPEDAKARTIRAWQYQGDAVVRARDQGEFVTDIFQVFPKFDIDVHGLPRRSQPNGPDALEEELIKNEWEVPADWTWYLGVDPGHTHQAAIALAVPPPSFGDWILVAGEVYQENADAVDLATVVKDRWENVRWEGFAIDERAGRQTGMGTSVTVVERYEASFHAAGIRCRQTGSHFIWGSSNIASRNMVLRELMTPRTDGTIKLRLLRSETPMLARQFRKYRKKVTRFDTSEDVLRKDNDTVDALAYVISIQPTWVQVDDDEWQPKDTIERLLRKMRNQPEESGNESFYLGAGAAPTLISA